MKEKLGWPDAHQGIMGGGGWHWLEASTLSSGGKRMNPLWSRVPGTVMEVGRSGEARSFKALLQQDPRKPPSPAFPWKRRNQIPRQHPQPSSSAGAGAKGGHAPHFVPWILTKHLASSPTSSTHWLCELRQVTSPL